MTGARGILLLLGLLAAMPAVAGTLYRCDGANGSRSYTSKRVAGARCVVISYHAAAPAPQRVTPPPAAIAAGSTTSANPVEGSPVSASLPAQAAPPKQPKFLRMATSTTYSYVDAFGVRNFSNVRPRGVRDVTVTHTQYPIFQMETCYACGLQPNVDFARTRLNTTSYGTEIAQAARDYGVEESVIRAIIHAESAFRPTALSRVGAQGLMQLMPATARRFGVSDAFEPGQNIRGGVQYLAFLLKRFKGDLSLAAAGYNAGEGAVDKYGGVPPYSETRRYVQRVGMLAERYRGSLAVH